MWNCSAKKSKTIDELFEEQIKIRREQIAPLPVSQEVRERIERDNELIKLDLEKPSVTNVNYKIDDSLKPNRISEKEFYSKIRSRDYHATKFNAYDGKRRKLANS